MARRPAANPPRAPWLKSIMADFLVFALVLGGWIALQRFVLPRLGVST